MKQEREISNTYLCKWFFSLLGIVIKMTEKDIQCFEVTFFFFYIFNIKVYNNEITDDTTYELLYDTTNTVPGGAIYHDYPLAFNINLRNTTHTTTTK